MDNVTNHAVASHLLVQEKVRRFVFAGRAYFTLVNPITTNRLTFKVRAVKIVTTPEGECSRCDGSGIWVGAYGGRGACYACNGTGKGKGGTFRTTTVLKGNKPDGFTVHWLSGSDKDDDRAYKLLGMVVDGKPTDHPDASDGERVDHARKAFTWFLRNMDALPASCQVWHEGRCAHCSRRLTDPVSIEHGIGPICRGKYETDVPRVSNSGAHAEDQGIAASIQHAVQTLDPVREVDADQDDLPEGHPDHQEDDPQAAPARTWEDLSEEQQQEHLAALATAWDHCSPRDTRALLRSELDFGVPKDLIAQAFGAREPGAAA